MFDDLSHDAGRIFFHELVVYENSLPVGSVDLHKLLVLDDGAVVEKLDEVFGVKYGSKDETTVIKVKNWELIIAFIE